MPHIPTQYPFYFAKNLVWFKTELLKDFAFIICKLYLTHKTKVMQPLLIPFPRIGCHLEANVKSTYDVIYVLAFLGYDKRRRRHQIRSKEISFCLIFLILFNVQKNGMSNFMT